MVFHSFNNTYVSVKGFDHGMDILFLTQHEGQASFSVDVL